MPNDPATLSDIATSNGLILEAIESLHETCKLILAACQGDGTGELVTALRKLEAAVTANTQRLDGLPEAVADELKQD